MRESEREPGSMKDLPKAKVEKNWKTRLFWLIPLGAAGLAAYFIYSNVVGSGPTIHIYFGEAGGMEPGKSPVKYRGAEIGLLKTVTLTHDHRRVDLTVSLDSSAEGLAREGSRFWIVKPEVGVQQIRGLRTIVSGNYITVAPGNGKPQTEFTGLDEPPIIDPNPVLNLVLLSEKAGSVKKRSPVFYRGLQVGEVIDSELGPSAQTVHTTIHIKKHFAPLVRLNSKFWNAGGINLSVGLSGADISAQSAEALLAGAIDFATPDRPDKEAPPGTTFRLYDKPEDAWLAWSPSIPLKTNSTLHLAGKGGAE